MACWSLSACSWVDGTGSQSNVTPQSGGGEEGAKLLTERDTYTHTIIDDGNVIASFVLLSEGNEAAAECKSHFAELESASTLLAACDLRVEQEECTVTFIESATERNSYEASIPKLRQSIALKFKVTSEDINGAVGEDEITICAKAVNDAPVAKDHNYQVEYRGTLETSDAQFDENCRVVSGSGLLSGASDDFDFATAPTNGEAACLAAVVETDPTSALAFSANALGGFSYRASGALAPGSTDSFTYSVSDGDKKSANRTVEITVVGENSPPEILPIDTLTVDENSSRDIEVTSLASDPEGEALMVFSVSEPEHGTTNLDTQGAQLTYTPDTDYVGNDQFSVTVQDIAGARATGRVNILVARTNQAPEIDAPAPLRFDFNNGEPAQRNFEISVDDRETDPVLLQVRASSSRPEILRISDPRSVASDGTAVLSITPVGNGTSTITITVTDLGLDSPVERAPKSSTATVLVTIQGLNTNRTPIATDTTIEVVQDETTSLDLNSISSDPDSDELSFSLISPPAGIRLNDSVVRVRAAATQTVGTFTIEYTADDGDKSATGVITVDVKAKDNAAPIALDASASIQAGDSTSFDLATLSSDSDNDALTYGLVTQPAGVSLSGSTVTVSSSAQAADQVLTFDYRVSDGIASADGTLSVTINAVNRAPTTRDITRSISAGQSTALDLSTISDDPDNDTLSYSLSSQPAGTSFTSPVINFSAPATAATQTVTIGYVVSDGEASASGTLTINVTALPTNSPPTANNGTLTLFAGSSRSLDLATITSDADASDTLTYTLGASAPSGASLNLSVLTFTSATTDTSGTISVPYNVSDGLATASAVVEVTIIAAPPAGG